LGVLSALVAVETRTRSEVKYLTEDDRFWSDVVLTIDHRFPIDAVATSNIASLIGTHINGVAASPKGSGPASPRTAGMSSLSLTGRQSLQKNIGNMLRRLAFQRDPMLRVCHFSSTQWDGPL
jgi:hypothetical protein